MPQALHILDQVCVVAFAALAVLAALGDWTRFRIPNRLVLGIMGLWVPYALVRVLQGEPPIFIAWAIGIALVVLLIGFGLFALNVLGGGDVKMLAAATLWAAPDYVLPFILIVSVAGALLGLAFLVPGIGNAPEPEPDEETSGESAPRADSAATGSARPGATSTSPASTGPASSAPAPAGIVTRGRLGRKMPYGLAIAVGCVAVTLYRLSAGG